MNNNINFETVKLFEDKICEFFGSPYAIAVDSCTHGIELCLRHTKATKITVPKRTYLSIPFLAHKLNINLEWKDENWVDYYYLTKKVIDAAVLWKRNSYIPNTFMSLSFQYRKHLKIGRAGIILTDNKEAALELKKNSYDGRLPDIPWREQNIDTIGYHYYLTPEAAQLGLERLDNAINTPPKQWVVTDWPDLTNMDIFKNNKMSNKKKLNKEIRKKYQLEEEIKNNPDWCFCPELLNLESDIDWLNDEPIETKLIDDIHRNLEKFELEIFKCKRCGKKHTLDIAS